MKIFSMKLSRLFLFVPLTITAFFYTGCSNDPNSVGISLLPPQDSIKITTISVPANFDLSFLYRTNGTSSPLLTGMSNGIEARTLLGFAGISAIPTTATIDSAILTLNINYRFHDPTGTLAFEVHKVTAAVNPATFRWDSSNVPGVYSDTISGRFIKNISPLDSSIRVSLDSTLIRQWSVVNSGVIIFLPAGTIVAGFTYAANLFADYRPLLTVSYHDTAGTPGTFSTRSIWGVFVADGAIPTPSDRITLQAGVSERGLVRFDSLAIPRGASITQAIFQVALDTVQSLTNEFTTNTIDAFLTRKSSYPYDSLILGVTLTPAVDNGQRVYQANVRFIIQQWFLRQSNNGVVLRATGEQTRLDRFVLHGVNSAPALRPKLLITYSLLP